MKAMEKLTDHLRNRPAELRELKSKGVKVVGSFAGDYVPEELIYASGAVPICLVHGGDRRAVDATSSTMWPVLCVFAKAQFGERLLNEVPYYNMVDMLAAAITCQNLRRAIDHWAYYTGMDVFRIGVPHQYDGDYELEYYAERLRALKERLERLTGNEIDDEEIKQAIALYNRMRELLKQISLLRKAQRSPIAAREFIWLNHASCYADPAFMVDVLDSLCQQLKQEVRESPGWEGPRLLLIGPNVAYGDYKILDLVQESGGTIVAEELCEGVRYYWQNVDSDGDPIQALANKYLRNRLPCAFMRWAARKRFDFAMELAKEFAVAGVIWYQLQNCESYDMESYFFAQKMKERGLPMLILESDYSVLDRGPLKTRIDAFLETIKGV